MVGEKISQRQAKEVRNKKQRRRIRHLVIASSIYSLKSLESLTVDLDPYFSLKSQI
jgi:hypothetical protein